MAAESLGLSTDGPAGRGGPGPSGYDLRPGRGGPGGRAWVVWRRRRPRWATSPQRLERRIVLRVGEVTFLPGPASGHPEPEVAPTSWLPARRSPRATRILSPNSMEATHLPPYGSRKPGDPKRGRLFSKPVDAAAGKDCGPFCATPRGSFSRKRPFRKSVGLGLGGLTALSAGLTSHPLLQPRYEWCPNLPVWDPSLSLTLEKGQCYAIVALGHL